MKLDLSPILLLVAATSLAAAPTNLFVSPKGNEAGNGSAAQPFATIQRAMQAVRALKLAETEPGPVTVTLAGGTYELAEPLVFTPEDSGTAKSPITWRSAAGAQAVISGGRAIPGPWMAVPGKPYFQTKVPQLNGQPWRFNTIDVNGQSRDRARTPNWGEKVCRAQGRAPGEDERQAFEYLPGDIDPNWTNLTDADIVLLCSWTPTIHRIQEVVPERRVVRFHSSHSRSVDFWEKNFRYYVSNVFEALDQPGEWYLNKQTETLYYYPKPGEDLATAQIVAPIIASRLVTFQGDANLGMFIEHLRFEDLGFQHVDGDLDKYNGVYRQGHMFLTAGIKAEGLRNSVFHGCEIAHLGEYAMELAAGCRDVTIEQCHIHDIGAGALQLGLTDLGTVQKARAAGMVDGRAPAEVLRLTIDNNVIHRLGTLWHGSYGIVNRFASNTKITHNDMFDMHWDAIGLDARWNFNGENYSVDNEIAYNHLHHLGLGYHTDAGGVYQFGPLNTHIHHNVIHDTTAYPYICGYAGIYLDEQSHNALVENNLVYNLTWYAYFQHWGSDNVFRNNIGAFATHGMFGRGGVDGRKSINQCEFTRNIYLTADDQPIKGAWAQGERPTIFRDNLVWSTSAGDQLNFAGLSLKDWSEKVSAENLVIGDPGCKDPTQGDFTLDPNAPAVKAIGFKPFFDEPNQAGLYGDASWTSLPGRCDRRTPNPIWSRQDLLRFASFELTFDDLPDNSHPSQLRLSADGEATFAVTSETACTGTKSLKCTDRKGLKKSFYPYVQLTSKAIGAGKIVYSFDAKLDAQAPAPFYTEFRDREVPQAGPSLYFLADGTVKAGGKEVLKAPLGTWIHVEIRFALGDGAPQEYTLVVGPKGEQQTMTLPFRSAEFREIHWLGIATTEDVDGAFYLDNLKLGIE